MIRHIWKRKKGYPIRYPFPKENPIGSRLKSLLRKIVEVLVHVENEEQSGDYGEPRAVGHARNHRFVRRNARDVHDPVVSGHDFRILRDEEIVGGRQYDFDERHAHDGEIRPLLSFIDAVRDASVQDPYRRVRQGGRSSRKDVGAELRPDHALRTPKPVRHDDAGQGRER